MSEAKHTPGTWDAVLVDEAFVVIAIKDEIKKVVAFTQNSADAIFISAAPDMAEVLKAILPQLININIHPENLFWDGSEIIASARAALRKAGIE